MEPHNEEFRGCEGEIGGEGGVVGFSMASLAYLALPGLCNLSVSTALGEADSIKIKGVGGGRRVAGSPFDRCDWVVSICFLSLSE